LRFPKKALIIINWSYNTPKGECQPAELLGLLRGRHARVYAAVLADLTADEARHVSAVAAALVVLRPLKGKLDPERKLTWLVLLVPNATIAGAALRELCPPGVSWDGLESPAEN